MNYILMAFVTDNFPGTVFYSNHHNLLSLTGNLSGQKQATVN